MNIININMTKIINLVNKVINKDPSPHCRRTIPASDIITKS